MNVKVQLSLLVPPLPLIQDVQCVSTTAQYAVIKDSHTTDCFALATTTCPFLSHLSTV